MADESQLREDTHDPVRDLVRLAGARPEVPPARTERVRSAARGRWRSQTRYRSRVRAVRNVAIAAAAVLLLAVGLRTLPWRDGATSPGAAGAPPALVEALQGQVVALGGAVGPADADPWNVVPGGEIPPGSTVTTAGASRVSLRLESGHSVRLDAESSVHLLADGRLALDRGAVYVDSDGAPEGEAPVVVSTPLGRVREIGTRFEVRLEAEALRVRLRDGAVVVRADGAEHEVAAGEELLVSELDGVHRTTISPHDPAWAWTASIAPILPLEGRPAREFLEWYARERGLRLAFSDAEIAASTSDIELSGSARGLELDEALQVVLRTSRLRHRVEDGVLWIDRLR